MIGEYFQTLLMASWIITVVGVGMISISLAVFTWAISVSENK